MNQWNREGRKTKLQVKRWPRASHGWVNRIRRPSGPWGLWKPWRPWTTWQLWRPWRPWKPLTPWQLWRPWRLYRPWRPITGQIPGCLSHIRVFSSILYLLSIPFSSLTLINLFSPGPGSRMQCCRSATRQVCGLFRSMSLLAAGSVHCYTGSRPGV